MKNWAEHSIIDEKRMPGADINSYPIELLKSVGGVAELKGRR
jgi:hypothetical protein